MKLNIHTSLEFYPTVATFADSVADDQPYAVVFEIDDETAYFYALLFDEEEQQIVDALHIYNCRNITDADRSSLLRIAWSDDWRYAVLMINDSIHAVFDFAEKQGYSHTGFPPGPSQSSWSSKSRILEESLIDLLLE